MSISWKQHIVPSKLIKTHQLFTGSHRRMKESLGEVWISQRMLKERYGSQWWIQISKKKLIDDSLCERLIIFISEKSPVEAFPQQGLAMAAIYGEDYTYSRCNWCTLICTNWSRSTTTRWSGSRLWSESESCNITPSHWQLPRQDGCWCHHHYPFRRYPTTTIHQTTTVTRWRWRQQLSAVNWQELVISLHPQVCPYRRAEKVAEREGEGHCQDFLWPFHQVLCFAGRPALF